MSSDILRELVISGLNKAYWIETEMEELVQMEALIEMGEGNKKDLETLTSDSETHKLILEKWFGKLELEIPTKKPSGLPAKSFDFSGMEAPQMFSEILKYEVLLKDMYKSASGERYKNGIESLIPQEKTRDEFLSDIEGLGKTEEGHIEICKRNVGGFKEIKGISD